MNWPAFITTACIGLHVIGVWLAHNGGDAVLRSPAMTIVKAVLLLALLYWGGFFS